MKVFYDPKQIQAKYPAKIMVKLHSKRSIINNRKGLIIPYFEQMSYLPVTNFRYK
jgi:hypothetical protein